MALLNDNDLSAAVVVLDDNDVSAVVVVPDDNDVSAAVVPDDNDVLAAVLAPDDGICPLCAKSYLEYMAMHSIAASVLNYYQIN